ncbi:MAG: hypothetical protein HONBIEJF_01816 [Fimbriimonadaceae bacterium]|nr:hypothetical protein [Fimbriimonadaceae bacterium]
MLAALIILQTVDPYLLPIGSRGVVRAEPDAITRTVDGAKVGIDQIVQAAKGVRYVLVGESHTSADHHKLQARIIDALAASGRDVVVGFEMFTRPNQASLAPMTLGKWDDATFQREADWKGQWGFEYNLYKPIFDIVKQRRLPMVALNVPRDWVRSVGRGGPGALTADQKAEIPELYLGNQEHRSVFNAMMGGHPPSGAAGDNTYAAMVLWDEAMADTAIKAMKWRTANAVMVIVAGSGHVMYDQGIGYRIKRHSGENTVSVVAIDGGQSREVSRGLANFVYMSPAN